MVLSLLKKLRGGGPLALDAGIGTLFGAYLLWNVGSAMYLTVWTVFIQRLGASPIEIGTVVGGGALARALLSIPAGIVVDRFSPWPLMVTTMALPVPGLMLLSLATAWWQALPAAVVIELSGLAIPAMSALIAAATTPSTRTRAFTYVFHIAPQTALIIGPLAGGVLADRNGFRGVFLVAATCIGVGTLLLGRIDRTIGRRDASSRSDTDHAGSPIALLRDPAIRTVAVLHLLVPLLPFTGFILLANYLVSERSVSLSLLGSFGAVGAVSGLLAGLIVSHWHPLSRPFVGIGACLGCAVLALLVFQSPVAAVGLAVGYALRSATNPVWSLLSAAAADVTPERLRGRVFGLTETSAGIGDVGAPLAAGGLYAVAPWLPLLVATVTTLPLAGWAFVLNRRWASDGPAVATDDEWDSGER